MSLKDYEVENDKFEYGTECKIEYHFPCCCCKFIHGKCNDYPCSECGHNLNAVSQG
jgi:hypothetical protein